MGFPLFKSKKSVAEVDFNALPTHIAIIMDGNGRWAKKRGLPRTAGHAAGGETFRSIATYCSDIGIKYLTVYAFSTENWKRPQEEVGAIISLLEKYINEAIEKMERDNVRLKFLGDLSRLPPHILELIKVTNEKSEHINGMQANICFNYGGRKEITSAARAVAQKVAAGELSLSDIDESTLERFMYTAGLPDPELIIRPSGELRISNFLLWQSAYSEYYFTDTLWPDFDKNQLLRAIAAYQRRSRRFGGV